MGVSSSHRIAVQITSGCRRWLLAAGDAEDAAAAAAARAETLFVFVFL